MSNKARLVITLLVLAVLACSCPVSGLPGGTPAPPSPEPVIPSEPPLVSTEEPVDALQPIGIGVQSADGLAFYDLNGNLQYNVTMSDVVMTGPDQMHFAGGFSGGIPPIIYATTENQGELRVKAPASDYPLGAADYLISLVGVPGLDVFAYSLLDFSSSLDSLPSYLVVGSLASLAVEPTYTLNDPSSWVMRLLALDMNGDNPVGVWYTLGAWGIGGDIVFEPRKGLYYYNLSNGSITEWLDQQTAPAALSDDRTWVAYSIPISSLHLRNLQTGQTVEIPLAPTMSESRGSGDAVFSPGTRYVAWREGSGWQMAETPDFHSRIRVADLNGGLVLDMNDTVLSTLHNNWTHAWPVAWLDDQTLLLQIGWGDTAVLVRLSLVDQTPVYFVPGAFVGFMYP